MGLKAWPASGRALLKAATYHARRDGPKNPFVYNVDYLLLRMRPTPGLLPWPMNRGRFGLLSFRERDHGDRSGGATDWARKQATACGLPETAMATLWLLTQPRRFGYVFNPVSFWIFQDAAGDVRAVLAEVNNTYGDRHSYFCATEAFAPIDGNQRIVRPKRFHVSPFQEITGDYAFKFSFGEDRIAIEIQHRHGAGGMVATLEGVLKPLDAAAAAKLIFRRPFSAFRVIGLIHWQALRLAIKGVPFRRRPTPPTEDVTG